MSLSLWSTDLASSADDTSRYDPLVASFHVEVTDGPFDVSCTAYALETGLDGRGHPDQVEPVRVQEQVRTEDAHWWPRIVLKQEGAGP